VIFRKNVDLLAIQQSAKFDLLGQSTQNIVSILLREHHDFSSKLQANNDLIAQLQGTFLEESENTRRELLSAIGKQGPTQHEADADLTSFNAQSFSRQWTTKAELALRTRFEATILQKLSFAEISDRQDDIAEAHKRTFEWVYSDSQTEARSWGNISNWFDGDDYLYWVAGKAGSGKSTLMKYLNENDRTQQLLAAWAKDRLLLTPSFYAWNVGEKFQKSQEGLLRALLYQILDRFAALASVAFPTDWDRWREDYIHGIRSSTMVNHVIKVSSMKSALLKLVENAADKVAFCFLIDGLDEYSGNHYAIADFCKQLARSKKAKVCVSSRPLPVFEDAFGKYPRLILQNLTYEDIKLYTSNRLIANERFRQLMINEPAMATLLEESIVERASGVFLWVKVVIESLLDGIRNFDRMSDLQRRLEMLPTDLEALYLHMFQHVEPIYLEQAARLFRIAQEGSEHGQLSPLLLSFADDDEEDYVYNAPCQTLDQAKQVYRCREIEGRLKSRCRGLLEVQTVRPDTLLNTSLTTDDRILDAKIEWLHRTVPEYLSSTEIDAQLTSALRPEFDPTVALLKGRILDLKLNFTPPTLERFRSLARALLSCAAIAERRTQSAQTDLMDEALKAIKTQWAQHFQGGPGWQNNLLAGWELPEEDDDAFTAVCAMYSVRYTVEARLQRDSRFLRRYHGLSLLRSVTLPGPKTYDSWWRDIEMIEVLFKYGSDPNQIDDLDTPWQALLQCVHQDLRRDLGYARWAVSGWRHETATVWCTIFGLFLKYGANPQASYVHSSFSNIRNRTEVGKTYSALQVCEETFCKWTPSLGREAEVLLKPSLKGSSKRSKAPKQSSETRESLSPDSGQQKGRRRRSLRELLRIPSRSPPHSPPGPKSASDNPSMQSFDDA